jgi:predicted nucleotidyltransferase
METEHLAKGLDLRDSRELNLSALLPIVQSGPRPLFATVSGAHLYGFASANSDVDIRGAFVRPLDSVLGLGPHRDTLELSEMRDGMDVDWVAHDVLKFVTMMTKRNGYVLEQLYSPLVVHGGDWLEELRSLGQGSMIRPLYYHYRGFFHNQHKLITAGEITAKAVLYAYRVLLSGIHALKSAKIEAHLPTLLELYPYPAVGELLVIKQEGQERGLLSDELVHLHLATLSELEQVLDKAFQDSELPEQVENVSALSDYVVRARKTLGV